MSKRLNIPRAKCNISNFQKASSGISLIKIVYKGKKKKTHSKKNRIVPSRQEFSFCYTEKSLSLFVSPYSRNKKICRFVGWYRRGIVKKLGVYDGSSQSQIVVLLFFLFFPLDLFFSSSLRIIFFSYDPRLAVLHWDKTEFFFFFA